MKIIVILFIIIISAGLSLAQSSVPVSLIQRAENISGDTFSFTAKTKKGAIIYGVNSTLSD